jgi:lysylphosphatidylglycerol synthetase-like protein (DUF2156 family)
MTLSRHEGDEADALARERIAAHGFAAEHNADYFRYYTGEHERRVFFLSAEGYGLMAYRSETGESWELLSEPVAPQHARAALTLEFLNRAFAEGAREASIELEEHAHRQLIGIVQSRYFVEEIETLVWPLLDLRRFDAGLPGGRNKPLRNACTRFGREHAYAVVDAREAPASQLHAIVEAWATRRPASHEAYTLDYHRLIDDRARTIDAYAFVVDGQPQGLFGGWRIPNSRDYYLHLLLHSYEHWGLGEMVTLSAIHWAKDAGYERMDMGGSDEPLLAFKRRFGAEPAYRTIRARVTLAP